jgi:tetratricopeptide (TPR) repeat protein
MLCGLAIASHAATAQTLDPRQVEYCRVLRLYVGGDFDAAAATAASWTAAEQRQMLEAAVGCRHDTITPEAAVMLETDLAARLGGTVQTVADRLALAESAVQRLPKARAARFQEEWYVAASSLLLAWTSADRAWPMADRGLQRFTRSARLRMLVAKAEELRLHARDGNFHDPQTIATMARNLARPALGFVESIYRRALEADPDLHEARLHLGRVLFLHGELDEAREALTRVTAAADADVRVRYLAHLFLGAVDEYERDLDGARRHYEAALALGGDYQSAYVALSFVEAGAGRDARARELAARWAARAPSDDSDPWWDYQNGGADMAAFEWLHAQVIK